jgi:L-iditol 2-dehydrogenase
MQGKMKKAVLTDVRKIEIIEAEIPKYAPDEVLIKMEYVGICGSDLHFYERGRISGNPIKYPFVLGHESSGTVVGVGSNVKHLKAGDRVAIEPGKTCGRCIYCREGKYNLCDGVIFHATPPVDGTFCEYVAHEADLCFKLPDNVSTMEGALIEPLAVGFHAAMQGGAGAGQTAAVFGAGCIGIVSMLALKAMGAGDVYIADPLENRLVKAVELGAKGMADGADGYDLVIETSGSEKAVNQAVSMLKKGGTIVLVGYNAGGGIGFPINLAIDKEITVKTIFRYRHIYPAAIKSVADGRVNLKSIVSDVYNFGDIQEAMERCVENKSQIIKAVVKIT